MTAAKSGFGRSRHRGDKRRAAMRAVIVLVSPLVWLLSQLGSAGRGLARKIAIAAVAAGLVLAPLPLASPHHALSVAAAESIAQEPADHGHSHEDDESGEKPAGHLNGHDPADHSHQFAFFPGSGSHWGLPVAKRWPASFSGPTDPGTAFGIDRPPKLSLSL
jgi:hypothetical protein